MRPAMPCEHDDCLDAGICDSLRAVPQSAGRPPSSAPPSFVTHAQGQNATMGWWTPHPCHPNVLGVVRRQRERQHHELPRQLPAPACHAQHDPGAACHARGRIPPVRDQVGERDVLRRVLLLNLVDAGRAALRCGGHRRGHARQKVASSEPVAGEPETLVRLMRSSILPRLWTNASRHLGRGRASCSQSRTSGRVPTARSHAIG